MATDEGLYGQWPKCGEIDIMEVMGQDTSKSYHTIHYGYSAGSGHKENQGSKTLREKDFADEYHVFRMDWEPGKITWFVDDEQVYTTSDWYTGADDASQLTYPAPFDQDFYVILNLAVGGSWVGYPDDDVYAHMNDDSYDVDYVRVYQKSEEEYEKEEAKAKRPEKEPVKLREADENGNYVINGDFSKDIAFDGALDADDDNWKLHLEGDANETTYKVEDNKIKINPSAVGSQPHSVQLKQQNIPMYNGWEYELTFDAVADENRDIIIDVEGPDRGWMRYFNDTSVPVTTEKQSYKYTFTMDVKTDPKASLEFNLGKQDSTAAVTISNVKLVHKSGDEVVEDDAKTIRPDGNYIYNGGFDQGENRLGYWDINNKKAVSVTNKKNLRMLKVVAPEGTSMSNPVIVTQGELSPLMAGQYEISFNGYGTVKDGLIVDVAGKTFAPELTDKDTSYAHKFVLDKNIDREDSYVKFAFTKPGEYYIDNAFLAEAALLKNGSFNAGLAGFTPYIYDSVNATYVIDNMNGNDNTFAITIDDTVADTDDNCWYIQLNQDGIKLEKGKKYRVSFKAKASIDRVIKYSLQEFEGNWTNYSGTGSVEIGNQWKTFTQDFVMESETDPNTRFNITMGSVDGVRITEKHDVYIDDISLIEVTDDESVPEEPTPAQPGNTPAPSTPSTSSTPGTPSVPSTPSTPSAPSRPSSPASGSVVVQPAPVPQATNPQVTKPEVVKPEKNNKVVENTESTEDEMKENSIVQNVENTEVDETEEQTEPQSVTLDEQQAENQPVEKEHKGFFATIADFFKAIIDFFKSLFS
ncbi:MAG: carbohydrate binding domain-containing protein [Pseudobutyrivibrio sp.]|nr:carbohydrate binding domain-containing protein [Pseudobutyrivibrio sp.]